MYCCFEGQSGIKARIEAFRQQVQIDRRQDVPFFLQAVTLDLVRDHAELIKAVSATLGVTKAGRCRARYIEPEPNGLRVQRHRYEQLRPRR